MIERLIGTASLLLAEAGPNKAPDDNPEWGKAAPTGLFVLLVFVVVCYFLFRSMNRQIRKVPTSFDASAGSAVENHVGEASPAIPVVDEAHTENQSRPRLGTPEDLLAQKQAKRKEQIRKAKARAGRSDKR